jgi:hypothetical protein
MPKIAQNLSRTERALIHAAAFNLSLILRHLLGVGTARQAAALRTTLCFWLIVLSRATEPDAAAVGPTPPSSCRRRKDQCGPCQIRTLSTGW